jgi:hypothetical protein
MFLEPLEVHLSLPSKKYEGWSSVGNLKPYNIISVASSHQRSPNSECDVMAEGTNEPFQKVIAALWR